MPRWPSLRPRPVRRDGTPAWDTTLGRLEIVENASGIGGHDAWHAEATPRLLGDGTAVRVASGRQIELNKTVAGRQKDLDALLRSSAGLRSARAVGVAAVLDAHHDHFAGLLVDPVQDPICATPRRPDPGELPA